MKVMCKKAVVNIVLFMCVFVVAISARAVEKKSPENEKVAVVNGVPITKADFDNEIDAVEKQISMQGKPMTEEQRTELKSRIMESLIDQELLFQESRKQGIKVEKSAIDESFSSLRNRFDSDDEFSKALTEMNLTRDALESRIERSLAAKKLIDTQVGSNVAVSDKDNRAFYDSHPDYFKQSEQVKVSHMVIRLEKDADEKTTSEARKTMEKVLKRIKKGGDFAEIAEEFKESPVHPEGGELDYFSRGQLMKPIEDVAFSLKSGEVSDIVTTEYGLHVFKLVDKKPEGVVDYAEVKEDIDQYLKQESLKKNVDSYIQGLRKNAKIEKML